jgi:hypothetical protein
MVVLERDSVMISQPAHQGGATRTVYMVTRLSNIGGRINNASYSSRDRSINKQASWPAFTPIHSRRRPEEPYSGRWFL